MRVLGIDPGSETLGWGVVDGSGTRYSAVDFGVVRSNTKTSFSKRLAGLYDRVGELMAEHSPDVLSIEDTFYAVNVSVALKLGQVRGTMLLLAEQRGLDIDVGARIDRRLDRELPERHRALLHIRDWEER